MSLELLIQTIINGLFIGFLLGLASMGLTLIFGVMDIFNIAAGEMMMLGAYSIFWLVTLYALDPILGFPIVILVGIALGAGVYFFLIRGILGAPGIISLLTLFGLSSMMSNSMLLFWTPNIRGLPIFYPVIEFSNLAIAGNKLLASGFAITTSLGLLVLIKKTRFGRALRATVHNRKIATLMGVDVDKIYAYGFIIGITLTLFTGSLIALVYPFEPYSGFSYTLYAFCIVILGTTGNPTGSLVAALIIGLALSFTGSYWTQGMSPAVAYIILVITFLVKPEGLFGKKR